MFWQVEIGISHLQENTCPDLLIHISAVFYPNYRYDYRFFINHNQDSKVSHTNFTRNPMSVKGNEQANGFSRDAFILLTMRIAVFLSSFSKNEYA